MRKHHVYADEFSLNEAQCRYDARQMATEAKIFFRFVVSEKRESPRATIIEFDDTGAQLCWHCRISLAYNAKKTSLICHLVWNKIISRKAELWEKRTVKLARF